MQTPQIQITKDLQRINETDVFYNDKSRFYGTKSRVRFLINHGHKMEDAMEQAARERANRLKLKKK